jgi:hypothetical protein
MEKLDVEIESVREKRIRYLGRKNDNKREQIKGDKGKLVEISQSEINSLVKLCMCVQGMEVEKGYKIETYSAAVFACIFFDQVLEQQMSAFFDCRKVGSTC